MDDNDEKYEQARTEFGPVLRRMARGYESNPERRRDLLQEMHIALWRSLRLFDGQCSLKTWVYRVGHNVSASHVLNNREGEPVRRSRLRVSFDPGRRQNPYCGGPAQIFPMSSPTFKTILSFDTEISSGPDPTFINDRRAVWK
jgi:hypothetical protein